MDSDRTTPFAKHFQEKAFSLRKYPLTAEDRFQKEATLHLSFWVELGTMSLGVYDDMEGRYTHEFKSTDPGAVAAFIAAVEHEYEVTIPMHFNELAQQYLTLVPQSFGVGGDLFERPRDCEYCGSNGNEIEAFYFPPIEEGGAPSLAVENRYGCYGWDAIYSDPRKKGVEGLLILDDALYGADDQAVIEAVQSFRGKLVALLESYGQDPEAELKDVKDRRVQRQSEPSNG